MFKRMLSSIGIGSAKVDTVLASDECGPGEMIEAVVKIKGGKVEQTIDEIYFSIHCNYEEESEHNGEERTVERIAVLDKFQLGESLVIGPGEEQEIPLEFELPLEAPLTVGRTKVWVQTGLDIKKAVDPGDRDYIHVIPTVAQDALLGAINELGFELVDAECEAVRQFGWRMPFVQELEFKPHSGPFRGRLDELEIICLPREDHLEVIMEVDRRARGFSGFMAELLDRDEVKLRFQLYDDQLDGLTDQIYDMIDNYS